MSLPLIGVTTYGRDENNEFHLPVQYVECIRRAGGAPLLLPPGEPHWREVFSRFDGLLLTGGGDIDPEIYGGIRHETIYRVDPERDRNELAMALDAVTRGVPTLGICRGIQVINVALGGTLVEHLPELVGEKVFHRLPPRQPSSHLVRVKANSHLALTLGQTEINPVSWHHQAIRVAAPKLDIVAEANDGTIEAIEMPSHPWLIAVQWHPELTAEEDRSQQRLFDAFVKSAARLGGKRPA